MSDNFKPDVSLKKFFTEISSPRLIEIINGLCGTNYSAEANVVFENTEHFSVIGSADKNSVRGDLTVKVDD